MLPGAEGRTGVDPDHMAIYSIRYGFPGGYDREIWRDTVGMKEPPPIAIPILIFCLGEC